MHQMFSQEDWFYSFVVRFSVGDQTLVFCMSGKCSSTELYPRELLGTEMALKPQACDQLWGEDRATSEY